MQHHKKANEILFSFIYHGSFSREHEFPVDISFVALGRKCREGKPLLYERVPSILNCASKCYGMSSMFRYGSNDNVSPSKKTFCYESIPSGCDCVCETSASKKGTCKLTKSEGYRLYTFNPNKCNKEIDFICESGECINKKYKCNKTRQCSDGSDETIGCNTGRRKNEVIIFPD